MNTAVEGLKENGTAAIYGFGGCEGSFAFLERTPSLAR